MMTKQHTKTHRLHLQAAITLDGAPLYSAPLRARIDDDRIIFEHMINDGRGGVIHWLSTNDPRVTAQGNKYDRYSVALTTNN